MALIIPVTLLILVIVLANLVAESSDKNIRRVYTILLLVFNGFVVLLGLSAVVASPLLLSNLADFDLPDMNIAAAGWSLFLIGLWGFLVSLLPTRRLLGRVMPIDPASPVHTLALVLAGYLVGNTLLTLVLGGLEELAATAVAVSVLDIIIQQLAFVAVAFVGVGVITRRDLESTLKRLGLVRPTASQLLIGLAWIAILVFMQGLAGGIWALLNPDLAATLEGLNESLLGDFDTVGEWLILALAAGIGEEILFRGAIQPVFGLVTTSLLFAVVHVQYGFTPITVVVFLIGIILGLIRRRYNTTTAIFVHVGYNFTLGLLSLLAVYLEQFVPS
ncbi:MAG: CPBP family intramembrane metalloprotease [Anaerolineales bacterium]|nr:CPBP family intramembrane metalloprotease [Anaerolineales bacterium]